MHYRYTYIFVFTVGLIFVKIQILLRDRRLCLILKFIIVRFAFSETVCRYFFSYVQSKIAACLKGKSTVFLKWDGVREWFDKVEKGINEGKGRERKLLGKVTVIRRAHRVISHKATEACTSPKLSAKYILPPPSVYVDAPSRLSSHRLHLLETCLRQTTIIFIFFFNPFSLSSLIYCFIISLLHFFSLDFNSYFLFFINLFLNVLPHFVCPIRMSFERCSFARVARLN